MSRWIEVPDHALDRARGLRAAGLSWNKIGREVGFDREVLQRRIDGGYVQRLGRELGEPAPHYKPTEAEIRRLQERVPSDTRGYTARLMGDPLPGRSALDRRRTNLSSVGNSSVFLGSMDSREHMEDRHSNSEAVV